MHTKTGGDRIRRKVFAAIAVVLTLCLPLSATPVLDPPWLTPQRPGADPRPLGDKPQIKQSDEPVITRPRRVNAEKQSEKWEEPEIRVGLLTGVSSLTLKSSSELLIQDLDAVRVHAGVVANQLQVEVKASGHTPRVARPVSATYQFEVKAVSNRKQADEIVADLKKRKLAKAAVRVRYNQTGQYRIIFSQAGTERQAADVLERLRRAGYRSARLIGPGPGVRSQPISKTAQDIDRRRVRTGREQPQPAAPSIVASDRDKLLVSASKQLVVKIKPGSMPRPHIAKAESGGPARKPPAERRWQSTPATTRPRDPDPSPSIRLGNLEYRGEIHLVLNERGLINVVNVLPLEEYLRGVVPRELSPVQHPHFEALKAQAIAARSYALAHLGQYIKAGFDLLADTRSQVYGGLSAEHAVSDRAIQATRGVVALHRGEGSRPRPIDALYMSSCGGFTENNEEVFLSPPVPYLRSVECPPHQPTDTNREIVSSFATKPIAHSDAYYRKIKADGRLFQAVTKPAEEGRLVVEPPGLLSGTGKNEGGRTRGGSTSISLEVEPKARLFRRSGSETVEVKALKLVGGERILYHLNSADRVDFIEVDATDFSPAREQVLGSPHWRERLTPEEVSKRLERSRIRVGTVQKLVPVKYGPSGRVTELEVVGDLGTARLRGFRVRSGLGLKESLFVAEEERDKRDRLTAFVFSGRGWGHGVGMCQIGASGLAKSGKNYIEILQKYYTGISIERVY